MNRSTDHWNMCQGAVGQGAVGQVASATHFEDSDTFDIGLRSSAIPHRGAAVLTLGILSLVLFFPCSPIIGPIAWIMGHTDLRLIRAGHMDRSGEGMTQAGMILGIITTVLAGAIIGLFCLGGLLDSMRHM